MDILIISNDKNYADFLSRKVSDHPSSVVAKSDSVQAAVQLLNNNSYKIIILCLPLLAVSCPFEALKLFKPLSGNAKLLFIMDHINVQDAMQLVHEGIYTCFNRPFPLDRLINAIKNIQSLPDQGNAQLKVDVKTVFPEKRFVKGISSATSRMFSQIALVAPTSFSVIIYGETGTGKESVACEIAAARKAGAPYITVDCGCLSKELALSELFGHEKGSFTGAVAQKTGAFELADKGTLFLDEIGNLDTEVQGYLLRAIQERKIRRVGGNADIPVSVRIIVASNEDLSEAVKKGKFREDLFHRLNEFKVTVPPLRSRVEDLPLLIEHFVKETNTELNKHVLTPDTCAMLVLQRYNWKGNVRELRNIIRRACLLTPDDTPISFLQLPDHINEFDAEKYADPVIDPVQQAPFKGCKVTASLIVETLKTVNYNKTLAAQILGIDRKTIYNKLKANKSI